MCGAQVHQANLERTLDPPGPGRMIPAGWVGRSAHNRRKYEARTRRVRRAVMVGEGAVMRVIAARRAGPSSFQVILGELTPGRQPCALHLLGMVSGVGAPPSADRRNQSEIYRMFLRRDMVRDTLRMALCLRRAAGTSRTAGGTRTARRQGCTQAARRRG